MLQLIYKFFLIGIICLTLSGCVSSQPETPDEIIEKASHQKIFFAPYDAVWKAAHSAIKYTISLENQDYGVIETDFIKSVDGWLPPNISTPKFKSGRYKLIFSFAKGSSGGKESTRVTIEKRIEIFTDFISETKNEISDGLEEQSIFYRIERELVITAALRKAAKALE